VEKRNIWKDVKGSLELHEDDRGKIVDIFYNDKIEHVSMVQSKTGAIRGNHYHKNTIQHILITKGALEYWYKPVDSQEPAKMEIARIGDVIRTPPNEIHALKIIEDNEFVVFTVGQRGGKDYESDTFRVKSILP